jgi:glycosyltransferase involved in cell wall biosynthesis
MDQARPTRPNSLSTLPSVSVAMCTFNGERFLREQLDSIAAQTLLPNELVICDDRSNDQTAAIVADFAQSAPFRVHFHRNDEQLGTVRNFERAIRLCTGTYVMLADQDDYWLPEKIAVLVTHLNEHPLLDVVFSDARLVDEKLEYLNRTIWEEVRFDPNTQRQWRQGQELDVLIQGNRVTGCTMGFRRSFAVELMPFPLDLVERDFIHDTWLALVAALTHRIDFVAQALVWYRQHSSQQIGASQKNAPPPTTWRDRLSRPHEQKLSPFAHRKAYYEGLLRMATRVLPETLPELEKLRRAVRHYQHRATLPTARLKRLWPVTQALWGGHYHHFTDADARWYAPWLAVLGDVLE